MTWSTFVFATQSHRFPGGPSAGAVLLAVARFTDFRSGEAGRRFGLSVEKLAQLAHMSGASVRRMLNQLADAGLLEKSPSGYRRTLRIRLKLREIQRLAADSGRDALQDDGPTDALGHESAHPERSEAGCVC